jgi:hypothetical protein
MRKLKLMLEISIISYKLIKIVIHFMPIMQLQVYELLQPSQKTHVLRGCFDFMITSFMSEHSNIVKVQGALSNVTWPFLHSINHALYIFPQHCKSIQIANDSRMPTKWSHTIIVTFLKMCIGSSKWLIFKSSQ